MSVTTSPTITEIATKVRAFLLTLVPAGVEVVRGLDNKVPEPPASPGFIAMTLVRQERLRTNVDHYSDPPPFDASTRAVEQGTQLALQCDCYGADSAAWAAQISTYLRSDIACDALAPEVAPLYAEEPIMAPLVDGERKYEQRWIVGAILQANFTTVTPQQFAGTLAVDVINVDERYPP